MSVFFVSCSSEQDSENLENSITNESLETATTEQRLPAGICPPGYVAVWDFDVALVFAKPFTTCRSGFGFCFIRTTVTLDCKRELPLLDARYNSNDDSMSVVVEALNEDTARVWIDSRVEDSPSHSPSDFDTMTIEDFELSTGATLTAGSYSKNVSGSHFYYDVPFK